MVRVIKSAITLLEPGKKLFQTMLGQDGYLSKVSIFPTHYVRMVWTVPAIPKEIPTTAQKYDASAEPGAPHQASKKE